MIAPEPAKPNPPAQFREALPRHVRDGLHDTVAIAALVTSAVDNWGWTAEQLAAECSRDLEGVVNAGAVVTHRLRNAATHAPPDQRRRIERPPWCGQCDEETRQRERHGTHPYRCPECHPLTQGAV